MHGQTNIKFTVSTPFYGVGITFFVVVRVETTNWYAAHKLIKVFYW